MFELHKQYYFFEYKMNQQFKYFLLFPCVSECVNGVRSLSYESKLPFISLTVGSAQWKWGKRFELCFS